MFITLLLRAFGACHAQGREDLREYLTRVHSQNGSLGILALQLSSHVPQHLVQSRLRGCVCAESARCVRSSDSVTFESCRFSMQQLVYLPIFEVAKVRRRARITRDEDYSQDGYLRREKLLSCDDGANGVGAKVVIEICERATPFCVRIGRFWQLSIVERTSRLLAIQSAC
jgi:hypothetical protein